MLKSAHESNLNVKTLILGELGLHMMHISIVECSGVRCASGLSTDNMQSSSNTSLSSSSSKHKAH